MLPLWGELDRKNRGVVDPVLEEGFVTLDQLLQLIGPVAIEARMQSQIVRARHDVDRIELDVAHASDGAKERRLRGASRRVIEQALAVEQQPGRLLGRNTRNAFGVSRH